MERPPAMMGYRVTNHLRWHRTGVPGMWNSVLKMGNHRHTGMAGHLTGRPTNGSSMR